MYSKFKAKQFSFHDTLVAVSLLIDVTGMSTQVESYEGDSSRSGGTVTSPREGTAAAKHASTVSSVTEGAKAVSPTPAPAPPKRPLSSYDQEFLNIFGEPVHKADHAKKKKSSKVRTIAHRQICTKMYPTVAICVR